MKVFRFGKFYEYNKIYADKSWSSSQIFKAASLWATCCHLGYEENLSYSLSYMYIMSESVPEIKFEEKYLTILNKIMDRVEIT